MKRILLILFAIVFGVSILSGGSWLYRRYAIADTMNVPLTEYSNAEYPEDPANRSIHYGKYSDRKLKLIKRDETHFDFVLEPTNSHTAKIIFKNIDVSLMTPSEPEWAKSDPGLERIALTDRQWNRQQVSFMTDPEHIEVTGGDGFEKKHLYSAELAKNCLNAGLWEVLLFTEEDGQKALYFQDWFTFPLGHYKRIFEANTGISYLKHWYKFEHWSDPKDTSIDLQKLRQVQDEKEIAARFEPSENIIVAGEQLRKQRTVLARNLLTWSDFVKENDIRFASFAPPGRYSVRHPWKNEYWRLAKFDGAILRDIRSPAQPTKTLQELELVFVDAHGSKSRFIVSGFELLQLPQLSVASYPRGMYMPMGIGVPPFFQSYAELVNHPPDKSAYFSMLLDSRNRWINHHDVAIDGPVLHRDKTNPNLLHVYLLSYERHALIGHYLLSIDQTIDGQAIAKVSGL